MNHWKKLLSGILTLAMLTTLLAVGGRHNILYIGPAGTGKSRN